MLEKKKRNYMKNNKRAKNTQEFDNRFDQGEDIHDLLDMSQARISGPGQRVRITLDVAEELIKQIDSISQSIGIDRGALIKVWLYERVKQESKEKFSI